MPLIYAPEIPHVGTRIISCLKDVHRQYLGGSISVDECGKKEPLSEMLFLMHVLNIG